MRLVTMARALKLKEVTARGRKTSQGRRGIKSQMNEFVERIHVITRNLVQLYEITRPHRGTIIQSRDQDSVLFYSIPRPIMTLKRTSERF